MKYLALALGVTIAFFAVELVGGILTNSLTLLMDAWHMMNHVLALVFALVASWLATRPITPRKTYGYYRTEILAAFLNGIFLWAVAIYIFYEALQRLQSQVEVAGPPMLVIAVLGLVANGLSAWALIKSGRERLNIKGAFLHVVADILGSLGAISAALIILVTRWFLADPLISMLMGGLIFYSSGKLVRDSLNVLLEGVPSGFEVPALKRRIQELEEVKEVHDLHVWCIASDQICMSSHVVVEKGTDKKGLMTKMINILKGEFGVGHTTIQLEDEGYPKASGEH
jgi:cobalt-zinc-cadmium efflux system protein